MTSCLTSDQGVRVCHDEQRGADVWNEVPLVPQTTHMSCWAAAAAMLVGWRESVPVRPDTIASLVADREALRRGLHPTDVDDLAAAWRLVPVHGVRWTAAAFAELLARHGPLWVGEASPGLHAIVITGLRRDPQGTTVRINDPWPIGRGERYSLPFGEFLRNFERAGQLAGEQIQVMHSGGRGASRQSWSFRSSTSFHAPGGHMEFNNHGADDEYGSEPHAGAADTTLSGSDYIASSDFCSPDPLGRHGGERTNVFLRWSALTGGTREVDVVVCLHGYSRVRGGTLAMLRGKVGEWGLSSMALPDRPTLVIMPRGLDGGPTASDPGLYRYTFPGLLANDGAGLNGLVQCCLSWLGVQQTAVGGDGRPLSVARLILAAHSGGGAPLNTLLRHHRVTRVCNPDVVLVFDALYRFGSEGQPDSVRIAPAHAGIDAWLASRRAEDARAVPSSTAPGQVADQLRTKGGALRVFYRGGTAPVSQALAAVVSRLAPRDTPAARFYRVESTSRGHSEMLPVFVPLLLADPSADVPLQPTAHGHQLESLMYASPYESNPRYGNSLLDWIRSPDTSGIELLTDEAQRRHFLQEVDWRGQCFPGNEARDQRAYSRTFRSNESRALFAAMARVIPERRVPQNLRYHNVEGELAAIPGGRLHRVAAQHFIEMAEAARRDGVELRVVSSFRSEAQQQAIRARNSNPNAVAQGWSAHTYGLAVDLDTRMPGMTGSTSTSPMTDMVLRYKSPTYKWMAKFASRHGFFPYAHEPWHWEYNPEGFKAIFEGGGRHGGATYGTPVGLFHQYPAGSFDDYGSAGGPVPVSDAMADVTVDPWSHVRTVEDMQNWQTQRRAAFAAGVANPGDYPFSVICRATSTAGTGTAFFISDRWLLTAGHVIATGSSGPGKVASVTLKAGYQDLDGAQTQVATYTVPSANIFLKDGYTETGPNDIALIKLPSERSPGGRHFTMREANFSPSSGVFVCGYAGGAPFHARRQRIDWDTVRELIKDDGQVARGSDTFHRFTYSLLTRPGTSGSPVFFVERGTVYVYGVHVSGRDGRTNMGVALTADKLQWIRDTMRANA